MIGIIMTQNGTLNGVLRKKYPSTSLSWQENDTLKPKCPSFEKEKRPFVYKFLPEVAQHGSKLRKIRAKVKERTPLKVWVIAQTLFIL